jgi:plasmid stability protein
MACSLCYGRLRKESCLKQILLRKVPDDLHKKLKAAAVQAEKPMQSYIIEILARAVGKVAPRKRGKGVAEGSIV